MKKFADSKPVSPKGTGDWLPDLTHSKRPYHGRWAFGGFAHCGVWSLGILILNVHIHGCGLGAVRTVGTLEISTHGQICGSRSPRTDCLRAGPCLLVAIEIGPPGNYMCLERRRSISESYCIGVL